MAFIHSRLRHLVGEELTQRLLGSGMIALFIKLLSALASYAMLVAFARMLSSTDYGHFGLMMNLAIVLSSMLGIGFITGVMRFWPEHVAKSEPSKALGFLRASVYVPAALSVGALVLAILAMPYEKVWRVFGSPYGPVVVVILATAIAYGDLFSNALRVFGSTIWSLLPRDVIIRLLAPAVAAVVLYLGGSIDAIRACLVFSGLVAIVSIVQLFKTRDLAHKAIGRHPPVYDWRTWNRSLIAFCGSGLLLGMVQQLDVVVVGSLIGPEEAGAYFASQKTAALLSLVMIAGGIVAAPMISAAYHAGRHQELQRLCRLLSLAIASTTFAGFIFMVLIGKFLLGIFDESYTASYPILMILSFGMMLDALAGPTAYVMQMTAYERPYLRIMAIVYALVFAAQIVFVPKFGVIAAAVCNALGVLIWNALAIQLLRRKLGIDPSILGLIWPVGTRS